MWLDKQILSYIDPLSISATFKFYILAPFFDSSLKFPFFRYPKAHKESQMFAFVILFSKRSLISVHD